MAFSAGLFHEPVDAEEPEYPQDLELLDGDAGEKVGPSELADEVVLREEAVRKR